MATDSLIYNLKLQFALGSADNLHAALRASLEQGIPDKNQQLELLFGYTGTVSYATGLVEKLNKAGALIRADHPALHNRDAVQRAAQAFEQEIASHLEKFTEGARLMQLEPRPGQERQGEPWADHVRPARSPLPLTR